MGVRTRKNIPRTLDLRDRLKSIVETELDRLPNALDGLTDKERLDIILKGIFWFIGYLLYHEVSSPS